MPECKVETLSMNSFPLIKNISNKTILNNSKGFMRCMLSPKPIKNKFKIPILKDHVSYDDYFGYKTFGHSNRRQSKQKGESPKEKIPSLNLLTRNIPDVNSYRTDRTIESSKLALTNFNKKNLASIKFDNEDEEENLGNTVSTFKSVFQNEKRKEKIKLSLTKRLITTKQISELDNYNRFAYRIHKVNPESIFINTIRSDLSKKRKSERRINSNKHQEESPYSNVSYTSSFRLITKKEYHN